MHVYEYLCNALMIFRVSSVFKIVRYIFVKAPKRCTGLLDKIGLRTNTHCYFSMEYWRNWWHLSRFWVSSTQIPAVELTLPQHNLLQEMDGLDLGDCSVAATNYVINLRPESVEQLTFFQSLLEPTLYRFYEVVSNLTTLVENDYVDKTEFIESVVGQSPGRKIQN